MFDIEKLKKEEFNELAEARKITCPNKDHIVFSRFYDLCKKYRNTSYIKYSIKQRLKNRTQTIDNKINKFESDVEFYYNKLEEKEAMDKFDKEFKMTKDEQKRFDSIDIKKCEKQIDALNNEKDIIAEWMEIVIGNKENLVSESGLAKDKNNLFSDIITEFFNIYNTTVNIKPTGQLRADIFVLNLKNEEIFSKLAEELSKQIGLCIEGGTGEYFYSDGDGKFIPFTKENNLHILKYIQDGIVFNSPKGIKGGYTLNIDDIFERTPKWINVIRYKNPELIGFNNCFYNVQKQETQKLQPKIPLFPLRTILTELYLDEKIDGGALEDIFNRCFSPEDKKMMLALIGCSMYDKGYTQRQENAFLISKGNIGKSTFIKAITNIFYSVKTQAVRKLDDNKFGFSLFAEADCVIMDEVQNATPNFPEHLKTISTGLDLPLEKKNKDTINLPAEIVPRCWFSGNYFPIEIYDAIAGEGVTRRIIPIIPTKSFLDCNHEEWELYEDNCKRWLVQQATKTYIEMGLNEKSKSVLCITPEERVERIDMCTFPEEFFLQKHFKMIYDGNKIDESEDKILLTDLQTFIHKVISDNILESKIRINNQQSFIGAIKNAFDIDYAITSRYDDGKIRVLGLNAKSDEAIEYFENLNKEE